jgi:hypothetical protein
VEPDRHVRVVLTEARRQGLSFKEGWGIAIQSLPRTEVDRAATLRHLAWAQPAFRAAYDRLACASEHPPAADWDADPDIDATVLYAVAAAILDGDADPQAPRLNGDDGSHQAPARKASSGV